MPESPATSPPAGASSSALNAKRSRSGSASRSMISRSALPLAAALIRTSARPAAMSMLPFRLACRARAPVTPAASMMRGASSRSMLISRSGNRRGSLVGRSRGSRSMLMVPAASRRAAKRLESKASGCQSTSSRSMRANRPAGSCTSTPASSALPHRLPLIARTRKFSPLSSCSAGSCRASQARPGPVSSSSGRLASRANIVSSPMATRRKPRAIRTPARWRHRRPRADRRRAG